MSTKRAGGLLVCCSLRKRGCLGPGADLLRQEEWLPREWVSTRQEAGKGTAKNAGTSRGVQALQGPSRPWGLGGQSEALRHCVIAPGLTKKSEEEETRFLGGGARCVCSAASANGATSI